MLTVTFWLELLRGIPAMLREVNALWGKARQSAAENRAAKLAARQATNSADLLALRRQAEADSLAAEATKAMLAAKAGVASDRADAPAKAP